MTKKYGSFTALKEINLELENGVYGLLAPNGAGKTTTFRMIMGLLDMTEGEITLDGKKIDYGMSDKIGFLTEERSLLPSKTVLEQVIYYGVLKGMKPKEIEEKLDKYLKEFGIEDYKNKKIKEQIDKIEGVK